MLVRYVIKVHTSLWLEPTPARHLLLMMMDHSAVIHVQFRMLINRGYAHHVLVCVLAAHHVLVCVLAGATLTMCLCVY